MLAKFFNRVVVVRRLKTVSTDKRRLSATATVDCAIQNVENFEQQPIEGVADKQYKAWFDLNEDIKEGDVLTDDLGRQFKVLATERLGDGMGLNTEHLEVVMQKHSASVSS